MLRELPGYSQAQRVVFVCSLGDSLQELTPVMLLKNQFRKNTGDNFLLIGDRNQAWLHMGYGIGKSSSRNQNIDYGIQNESGFSMRGNNQLTNDYYSVSNKPTAIRLSLMNQKLTTVRDTLIENDGNIYDVLPRPFGRFIMKGKAYLVLIQNFSPRKRGLLLVSGNDKDGFRSQDIPVFDRFQYLLSHLQVVGNSYFIVPYSYKNETGLIKITMDE